MSNDDDRDIPTERRRRPNGRRQETRYDPATGEPVPDRRRKQIDADEADDQQE